MVKIQQCAVPFPAGQPEVNSGPAEPDRLTVTSAALPPSTDTPTT